MCTLVLEVVNDDDKVKPHRAQASSIGITRGGYVQTAAEEGPAKRISPFVPLPSGEAPTLRHTAAGDGEEGRVVRYGLGARIHGPRPQGRHHRRQGRGADLRRAHRRVAPLRQRRLRGAAAGDRGGHQGQGDPRLPLRPQPGARSNLCKNVFGLLIRSQGRFRHKEHHGP